MKKEKFTEIARAYNPVIIEEWMKTIVFDEFDDTKQNDVLYDSKVSGYDVLKNFFAFSELNKGINNVIDIGAGKISIFEQINPERNDVKITLVEPSESRSEGRIAAWAENLPIPKEPYDLAILWGTFCFLRSHIEAMISINSVLRKGGIFVVDIVEYSTMALVQTVNAESFARWVTMFGFKVLHQTAFGKRYHQRVGFVLQKTADFDYRSMRMPHTDGKGHLNNFLENRDWYIL